MDLLFLIVLIAVVAVLAIGAGVGLLVRGGRKQPPAPTGGTDVIAPPPTEVEAPAEAPPAAEVPEAPVLEKPEGTASRLVRVRVPDAVSQAGLCRCLMCQLSRDRLD